MIVSTKAIVLSKIKYKDSDLIIKCYTEKFGIISYLVRNVIKTKKGKFKSAYFQPLSLLDIEADHKENRSLQYLRDIKLHMYYSTLHTNVIKSTIVMFLSEVLSSILKEEEENEKLYSFLETTMIWFDETDTNVNFHLLFLLQLTKYLGFYPDTSQSHLPYFNLEDGKFHNKITGRHNIQGENLILFKEIIGTKFDVDRAINFKPTKRLEILNIILNYFKLHIEGFKQPKSITVLNQIFH
ncbi:DNA repair protein RecO [Pontimicrobium aquaticum]|uniref:DNA repair protein RecO n=1 Tax=Pontimicrobium aquaticum TaxID=2565367 RepID=A0A4U0F129_9FLAO|nr:DNA repair protein RecO [Pontimicrobium aquaticum]TJY38135.1 DNA repair protein RecO [Pontimicrobium aquaticum]